MFAFLTEVRVLRRLTDNTDRGVTGASVLKPVGVQSVSEIASATTRRESLVILKHWGIFEGWAENFIERTASNIIYKAKSLQLDWLIMRAFFL